MDKLTERIYEAKKSKDNEERTRLIQEYTPFIMSQASKATGGSHISYENSMELSIALLAFNEALDRYDESKGSFIKLASLVITSRIRDWQRKEKKHYGHLSIYDEDVIEQLPQLDEEDDLKVEVAYLNEMLNKFAIDLDDIVDEYPSHAKVKQEMIEFARLLSRDNHIVEELYKKKRLPNNEILKKYKITKKKLKYHRKFIIFIILIYSEKMENIMEFMV